MEEWVHPDNINCFIRFASFCISRECAMKVKLVISELCRFSGTKLGMRMQCGIVTLNTMSVGLFCKFYGVKIDVVCLRVTLHAGYLQ